MNDNEITITVKGNGAEQSTRVALLLKILLDWAVPETKVSLEDDTSDPKSKENMDIIKDVYREELVECGMAMELDESLSEVSAAIRVVAIDQ